MLPRASTGEQRGTRDGGGTARKPSASNSGQSCSELHRRCAPSLYDVLSLSWNTGASHAISSWESYTLNGIRSRYPSQRNRAAETP